MLRCIGKFITGPPDLPRGGHKLQSGWKIAIGPWRRSENASTILGISIHQEQARMLELNKKKVHISQQRQMKYCWPATSLSTFFVMSRWRASAENIWASALQMSAENAKGSRNKKRQKVECCWLAWNKAVPKVPAALHTAYFAWSITGARAALCQNWNEVSTRE